MHAYGPAAWDRGVHCFSGEIEQSSLDSAEGRPTEKNSCGDEARKTPVVRDGVVHVTVNVLSGPQVPYVGNNPLSNIVNNSTLATATWRRINECHRCSRSRRQCCFRDELSGEGDRRRRRFVSGSSYRGVAGNAISYSLQNTAYSLAEFCAPSFPSAASSGGLRLSCDVTVKRAHYPRR
jgi:hypothetical protein